jgi:O-succinylbenzoic acid--CoA ligase
MPTLDDTDILRARAASTPETVAIRDPGNETTLTYGALDMLVDTVLSAQFDDPETGTGRIVLCCPAGPACVVGLFLGMRLDRPVALCDPTRDDATLADQIERSDPSLIVTDPARGERLRNLVPTGVQVTTISKTWTGGMESDPAQTAAGGRDRDWTAEQLLLFTSGSTGEPKGVRLSLRNVVASAHGSAERLGVEPGDRWLLCLPMHHMGGLAPLLRSTLYGTTTVLQHPFDASTVADSIAAEDVTCVSLVPTMLRRLLDAAWEPPSSLRFVLVGGAPVPAPLVNRARSRGVPVAPTYGMTETASQIATASPEVAGRAPGTVGRPLAHTTVKIRDTDGEACPQGETGRITVAGPTVCLGYLDNGRTVDAFGPDGFDTGDHGYLTDDGLLVVTGRADDLIQTGGRLVAPDRVRSILTAHDGIESAAVLGIEDDEWGERVAAVLVTAEPALTTADLREYCRRHLAPFEVPKSFTRVDSLPRTAAGSIDREAARALLR